MTSSNNKTNKPIKRDKKESIRGAMKSKNRINQLFLRVFYLAGNFFEDKRTEEGVGG